MKKTSLYLAYGSNLNIPQMMRRCPTSRIIGTAEIANYRLLFKDSKTGSYLTIEPAEGFTVPVGVWEITEEDEEALDFYEGYPSFYYKKTFRLPIKGIRTRTVRRRTAFAYIMHEDRSLGIPTSHYVQVCRAGYDAFGFDQQLITEAVSYSIENVVEECSAAKNDSSNQSDSTEKNNSTALQNSGIPKRRNRGKATFDAIPKLYLRISNKESEENEEQWF